MLMHCDRALYSLGLQELFENRAHMSATMLTCGPFLPATIWTRTRVPSARSFIPACSSAERCKNNSSPPPSGMTKPNPFDTLYHLMVPDPSRSEGDLSEGGRFGCCSSSSSAKRLSRA